MLQTIKLNNENKKNEEIKVWLDWLQFTYVFSDSQPNIHLVPVGKVVDEFVLGEAVDDQLNMWNNQLI